MMNKYLIALMGAVLLAFAGITTAAEDHTMLTLQHTSAAVDSGKALDAAGVVAHASEALKHAQAVSSNPHMATAITHLNAAIEHGNMGHAAVAATHAQEALNHVKMAGR